LLSATFKISQKEHSGTCFILAKPDENPPGPGSLILATAAHVLEQMVEEECELVLRTGNLEQGFQRLVVTIHIRDGDTPLWTRHPELDVATMQIVLPVEAAVMPIPIDRLVSETLLIDRTVRVGQEAWISCFPAKLEANEAGWPVLRKGSIATYPLFPVKTAKTILIDYKVFGGDSGAPIAIIHDGKLLVLGVASSMQRQTDRTTMPFEERTMHTPLGLSIVVQAAYLRETIDLMLAN
jgi:hypothetical protein